MNGRVVAGVLLALVVIVALVGLGIYVYQVGMAQGLAQADRLPAPSTAPLPVPGPYAVGPYFYRPWGLGFGCFGILIPILIVFFIFSLMRMVFWGGHWRRRAWMTGEHVPPMFDEWHKRAHEKQV